MTYDPQREIEKSEARAEKALNMRVEEVSRELTRLNTRIDILDDKLDTLLEGQKESKTWLTRYIITTLVTFFLGSGAIGAVQFLVSLLSRR